MSYIPWARCAGVLAAATSTRFRGVFCAGGDTKTPSGFRPAASTAPLWRPLLPVGASSLSGFAPAFDDQVVASPAARPLSRVVSGGSIRNLSVALPSELARVVSSSDAGPSQPPSPVASPGLDGTARDDGQSLITSSPADGDMPCSPPAVSGHSPWRPLLPVGASSSSGFAPAFDDQVVASPVARPLSRVDSGGSIRNLSVALPSELARVVSSSDAGPSRPPSPVASPGLDGTARDDGQSLMTTARVVCPDCCSALVAVRQRQPVVCLVVTEPRSQRRHHFAMHCSKCSKDSEKETQKFWCGYIERRDTAARREFKVVDTEFPASDAIDSVVSCCVSP